MAGAVTQSGAMVACPKCGDEVMQKSMIPVGVVDQQVHYLCVPCSRLLLRTDLKTDIKTEEETDAESEPRTEADLSA